MKQTLALRMGQQLAMTPQLQQAIRLMQLSALELKTEVRQTIEANPLLDLVEEADDELAPDTGEDPFDDSTGEDVLDEEQISARGDTDNAEDSAFETEATETPGSLEEIPVDLPVDVTWDDVYQPPPTAASASSAEQDNGFEERNGVEDTLLDHLLWQLNLAPLSDRDRVAAHMVIGNIDDDGMLAASATELVDAMNIAYGVDEMEAVIKLVQTFDPPGVAARDLRECLLLQLDQLPPDTPCRTEAIDLVRDHFALLANRDFVGLSRKVRLAERELVEVMALIRSLNPRPGGSIGSGGIEYIEPDVFVTKRNGRWSVELNRDSAPRLRINGGYAGMIRR
ncbi:MAG: RNA polymerase factor sigma-54, partial [Gammaproteobacteria bacterium]|nr:RNA polymerase factor sigma-54 [Gammaproteobacteria bacterium]